VQTSSTGKGPGIGLPARPGKCICHGFRKLRRLAWRPEVLPSTKFAGPGEHRGKAFAPTMKADFGIGSASLAAILAMLVLVSAAPAQERKPPPERTWKWDVEAWIAGATGEETTNSFAEAQLWTAGVLLGRTITGEVGRHFWRGRWEYGVGLVPVFVQSRTQTVYGGEFEPVILRWNSSRHIGRVLPYIEMGGGGLATTANLPPGNTSSFNFTARAGAGIQVFVRNRRSVDLGCGWFHASNANLGVENQEFNGVRVTLGYHWHK
jgi:hypothetical protein